MQLDSVLLSFRIVHVAFAGTESPGAFYGTLFVDKICGLHGIAFISRAQKIRRLHRFICSHHHFGACLAMESCATTIIKLCAGQNLLLVDSLQKQYKLKQRRASNMGRIHREHVARVERLPYGNSQDFFIYESIGWRERLFHDRRIKRQGVVDFI